MDERTVANLLRDAADDVPQATFDEDDIASRSRALNRKRHRIVAGSALAGVIVVCGGVAAGLGLGHTGGAQPMSVAGGTPSAQAPARTPGGKASVLELPVGPSLQGDGSTGKVGSQPGCRQADGELAAALAAELPSAASPQPPAFQCPAGSRFAGYATSNGVLSVLVIPGAQPRTNPLTSLPRGATSVTVPTAHGGTLYLVSEPFNGATATPADQLHPLAQRLAGKF